jgi:magnesium transporter
MITHYFRTIKDLELKVIDAPRSGVWTHCMAPDQAELDLLVKEYALDDAVLEDILDFYEVPRMERIGGVSYFFTRFPFEQKVEDADTAPLLIVMGESFVLTISLNEVPQFKPFFDGKEEIYTTQKAKTFIQIMEALTKSFERKLVKLRREVHRDRSTLRHVGNREIERFVSHEHELNDLLAAIVPTNSWLQKVTVGNFMQMYSEDTELMEDLLIANNQMAESARSVLKTIQNLRNASEAILTNNLNSTIRTLTVITIILTIPTIVASLFGMNVSLPLAEHPYAFWLILVFIMMIVSLVVWQFKQNRWL